jgi:hypothetical protein
MIKLKHLINEAKSAEFVRFGGLSPVKQRGFTADDEASYHSPPARKGIYAFPRGYVEPFLLGGGYGEPNVKGSANRMVYLKDKYGNKITNEHPDWEKYYMKDKYRTIKGELKPNAAPDEDGDYEWDDHIQYLVYDVKPKTFKHSGDIWHHHKEFVDPTEIIKEKGEWVKTNMDVYLKAFKQNAHAAKKEMKKDAKEMGVSEPKNALKWFTKDHLEVFIERVK